MLEKCVVLLGFENVTPMFIPCLSIDILLIECDPNKGTGPRISESEIYITNLI